jgi:hypothetical protein
LYFTIRTSPEYSILDSSSNIHLRTFSALPPPDPAPIRGKATDRKPPRYDIAVPRVDNDIHILPQKITLYHLKLHDYSLSLFSMLLHYWR